MKKQTLAVCIIATALSTFAACKWFGSNNNASSPLIGKWQIDSFDAKKDTGKAALNYVGLILLASQSKDSVKMQYEFAKDTLLFHFTNKETEKLPYQFNAAKNEVIIQDSIKQVLAYSKVNDSTISLMDKDSTTLYLRKVN